MPCASLKNAFQVDENMDRAQKRDAVRQQKFFFRKDVFPAGHSMDFPCTEPIPLPEGDRVTTPCTEARANPQPAPDNETQGTSTASPCPCSQVKTNGSSSPYMRFTPPLEKEKALRNCYPDIAPPVILDRKPVQEEYEEMTINEIINGKVQLNLRFMIWKIKTPY